MIRRVSGPDAESIIARSQRVVRRPASGGFVLTALPGWSAVPVESNGYLDDEAAGVLTFALSTGVRELEVALLEDGAINAFTVVVGRAAFAELGLLVGALNFALFPPDLAWLMAFSAADFYVCLGPAEIVLRITGKNSLGDAVAEFRADTASWDAEPIARAAASADWTRVAGQAIPETLVISPSGRDRTPL